MSERSMSEPVDGGRRMTRDSAVDVLARRRDRQVVMSTMTPNRRWREQSGSDRNLYCMGFMGGGSTFALGVALARPDVPVWVFDGDGSLLMQLGSLATIANAAPKKFLHVVFHNNVYETSGAQPLPGGDRLSFAGMAREAGYSHAVRYDDVEAFDAELDELLEIDGPVLVELMTQPTGSYFKPGPPAQEPKPAPLSLNWPKVRDALAADPPADGA